MARIDEPDKNWKFSLVPADDKENARLIVSRIVLDALEDLKMAYSKTTAKRRAELQSIRKHRRSRDAGDGSQLNSGINNPFGLRKRPKVVTTFITFV